MNPKQEKFCREYLVDLNATQALIRAGYSPNGANVTASQLLANGPNRGKVRLGDGLVIYQEILRQRCMIVQGGESCGTIDTTATPARD